MIEWISALVVALSAAVGAWAGYRLGLREGYRRAEDDAERLRRIEPPTRTPGQPTNRSAPASRVVKARRRSGLVHDIPTNPGEPKR